MTEKSGWLGMCIHQQCAHIINQIFVDVYDPIRAQIIIINNTVVTHCTKVDK